MPGKVNINKGRNQMSTGIILLAIWLILNGLPAFVRFVIPSKFMSAIALLAGILLLVGR
jgi:hypothetical protein